MSDSGYDESCADYDEIAEMYQEKGALNPVAELQGLWCGRLVGGARWTDEEIVDSVIDHMGVDELVDEEDRALLIKVFRRVETDLRKNDMSFRLMLPEDIYPLEERVTALGDWSRGFLEGLALEQGESLDMDDEDSRELLSDLVEISRIELESDDFEASEMQLIEVTEHVRIAVLHLYQEIGIKPSGSESVSHTLH